MEGQPRSSGQPAGAFTIEAAAALRALQAADRSPILLGYHPVARMNPYQALLYQRAWEAGIGPVPIVREERIEELAEFARLGYATVLHLHWLNLPLAQARSAKEAAKQADAFIGRLDAFRATGGRIAWTIHNILPHGARFDAEEGRLRAAVAERADALHILAAGTAEHVAPWFSLPADRLLHVPHPSYAGAYEDHVGRDQARHELGIMPDELVFVVAGAIRPYKGLGDLLDAWEALPTDVPRRLVIAGGPSDEPGVQALLERAALHPTVLLHARKIPAGEMQLFLRSADIAVLPYLRSLNSGALMLALTFGLPVIVPAGGGLAEGVDERFAITYDPDREGALVDALNGAPSLVTQDARDAASAAAAALNPADLARRFAFGLRELLERRPST
jgi:glycosyltransferase involved in cell wall biosynthesis